MTEASHPAPDFNLSRIRVEPVGDGDRRALHDLFLMGCVEGQVRENDTGADIESIDEAYLSDDGGSGFWVARLGPEVLGMVGVQRHDDNVAEIRRLRVHPDYRRRGIGSKLMETAIAFCRDRGYLKVILDTRVEREPAIRMFEKFGFVHARTRELENRSLIDFYLDMYREPGT